MSYFDASSNALGDHARPIPTPPGNDAAPPVRPLKPAPDGWLERSLAALRELSQSIAQAADADAVMRAAVQGGRDLLGFRRLGIWLFADDFRSLTGTFGINPDGDIVDERHFRVFDHGSVAPQRAAWSQPPYVFLRHDDPLRDSEGGIIAHGVHITAPLRHQGDLKGLVSVDDLHQSAAINDKTGLVLGLFADAIAAAYFLKLAESRARKALADSEKAFAIKREFLGMLSHEVRTPLNAILGFSQLLCMDSDAPEQAKLAKTIEESGDHLLNLLNSMMEYANLADEDLRRRFAPCDPVEIARDTCDSFVEFAKKKGLALDFTHKGDFQGAAMADPVGLRQILGNLIQNAIKFTEHGSIRLTVQSQPKPDGAVAFAFSVQDTGCGIDPSRLPEIFQPFKQLDSSLTRSHGGIGMGLAIVQRLAHAMGGSIDCDSQPGHGARFTFNCSLDYATAAPKVQSHHRIGTRFPSAKHRENLRLLIAEDNENNRLVLLSFLHRLGFRHIDHVEDGQQARLFIAQRPYDLLLFDLEMPHIDGLSLTRMVREGRCGPINTDVPIVGATAHTLKYGRERSMGAGLNDYLSKPFKAEQLEDALARILAP